MRDLNDKSTSDELTADEWNDVPSELQNIIESTGQTLTSADLFQAAKAIAEYAAAGAFFVDSGAADAYVLAPVGSRKAPTAYSDGQRIEFIAANPCSGGAVTVNVASLGSKSITTADGGAPASAAISGRTRATYHAGNDRFELEADITSVYASRDTMYTDSGSANSLVLTAVGEAPSAYFDGMRFRARPAVDNNGSTTVDVGGLGSKSVSNAGTGFIKSGLMTEFEYVSSTDDVRIVNTEPYYSSGTGFSISDGLITQYDDFLLDGDGKIAVTFPVAFPSDIIGVSFVGTDDTTGVNDALVIGQAQLTTTTGFSADRLDSVDGAYTVRYEAMGR